MSADPAAVAAADPCARLVLDTNVWLDVLVFNDRRVAELCAAIAGGRAVAFTDQACAGELWRVLAYPLGRFTLDAAAREHAWARFLALARPWSDPAPASARPRLPRCTDPDDQGFLELSLACGADALVTRDRALLRLGNPRHALPFVIVGPGALPGGRLRPAGSPTGHRPVRPRAQPPDIA